MDEKNLNFANLDLSLLDTLTPAEKELALSILKEYAEKGESKSYNDIILEDYNEAPVDILTFVDDYNYLGNAWHDAQGNSKLYPYWRKELKKLFPTNIDTNVNNVILSGSRGRGKTEIAVLIAAYLLHRILCLKDPIAYFHLKATEKIVFAFMNIKLALAEEIADSKFQNTIKSSPWFLEHGKLEGRTKKVWVPQTYINSNGEEQIAVDIKIGSQADDLIGLPIYYCLEGNTEILTSDGVFKIKDLENKKIKVPTVDTKNSIVLSDECTVKQTNKSNIEYEIQLEDNTIIKCTPNHRFRLVDGTYKEAQYLTADDNILSFNPYGYIYKTTNLINNKIYIGQHKGAYLDTNYLGSGYLLQKAIKKYKRENFKCELVELCENKHQLDLKEREYIKLYDSTNHMKGYNISEGGQGGDLGETARKNISKALKNVPKSEEHKLKLSNANKGKHLTEAQKQKISQGNKGKAVTLETRVKLSISAKNRDRSNYKNNKNKVAITNGIIVKYIDKEDILPDGYEYGNCKTRGHHNMKNYYMNPEAKLLKSEAHKGAKNYMYGKGYLRKGGNNTNSHTRYFYKSFTFECRKDLVEFLKENIDPSISTNLIINIEKHNYKKRSENKYKDLIDSLRWEAK